MSTLLHAPTIRLKTRLSLPLFAHVLANSCNRTQRVLGMSYFALTLGTSDALDMVCKTNSVRDRGHLPIKSRNERAAGLLSSV